MSDPSSTQARYVLIIDDEDDIREVASLSLEMTEGWRVAVAGSCAAGLELARSSRPDLVLLDVMMPDMDGVSGFKQLRGDPQTKHIPVIFLTAKVHESDLRKLLDLGVEGVIAKPFDPLTLGARIRDVAGWSREGE